MLNFRRSCALQLTKQLTERKQQEDQPGVLWSEYAPRAIPHSECNVYLNLTRNLNPSKRRGNHLKGLQEVLPGSTVCKTSPTMIIIKEPHWKDVKVKIWLLINLETASSKKPSLLIIH